MQDLDRYIELVRTKELTDDEKRLKEAYRYRFSLDDVLCNRVKMLYDDELYVFNYILTELEDRFDSVLCTTDEMRYYSDRDTKGTITTDEKTLLSLSLLRLGSRQVAKDVIEGTETVENGIEILWRGLDNIRNSSGR